MSAVCTTKLRVANAINLLNQDNLYFGIGRSSVWADENNPPTPLSSQTEIDELIYIKKVGVKRLVKINNGVDLVDVQINGIDYNYVDEVDAYTENASRIYFSCTILFGDIAPTSTTYRQIGLLMNPLDAGDNVLTGLEYLAASVDDQGQLLYIDNKSPVVRSMSQSEMLNIVINL